MENTVTWGKPNTAMQGFGNVLTPREIQAVVRFIRAEFMEKFAPNTRYHTAANGWPGHERYKLAVPFATGAIPLDTPWETLNDAQRAGWRLYFGGCITCHDRSRVLDGEVKWGRRALSYPRFDFQTGDWLDPPRSSTGATVFPRPDAPPAVEGLSTQERLGAALFAQNCAFCHGADGSGRNWIGRFLEPHPRDLTDPGRMSTMTRERLLQVLREGLPGTSMPAWRSVLSPEQIDAVIAYIARAFPADRPPP